MFEVEPAPKGAKPRLRTETGRSAPIAHARIGKNKQLLFLDRRGTRIVARHLERPPSRSSITQLNNAPQLPRVTGFNVDGVPIFVDPVGNVIGVEQGEADFHDAELKSVTARQTDGAARQSRK
jgi:hypothetical protein